MTKTEMQCPSNNPKQNNGTSDKETTKEFKLTKVEVTLSPADKRRFQEALEFERGSSYVGFSLGGPISKMMA